MVSMGVGSNHSDIEEKIDNLQQTFIDKTTELTNAVKELSDQMRKLTDIFETADKELADHYKAGVSQEVEKLNHIIDQNGKLARGLLAVADMVKPPEPPVSSDSPKRRSLIREFR